MRLVFQSLLMVSTIYLSSCAMSIERVGLETPKDEREAGNSSCEVKVVYDQNISSALAKELGTVKVGDGGLTITCDKATALEVLKKEACAQQANLVNVTEETPPDWNSSCYRMEADLYQLANGASIDTTDSQSTIENNEAKHGSIWLSVLGYALGFAIGFTVTTLLLK